MQVLATEVEQEEEYLVNTLQKRMGKLHLEKSELEKALEKLERKVIAWTLVSSTCAELTEVLS